MARLDLGPLLGVWRKTNEGAQALRSLEVREEEGAAVVRAFADSPPWPAEWGPVRVESAYAADVRSSEAAAFVARWDLGPLEVVMQANVNLGLLVVACFHRSREGGERADLFTREFFYKAP